MVLTGVKVEEFREIVERIRMPRDAIVLDDSGCPAARDCRRKIKTRFFSLSDGGKFL
jgi:hypothetical protein